MTFNLVIDACAKINGKWEQASKLIGGMQAANVSLSAVTLNVVFDACAALLAYGVSDYGAEYLAEALYVDFTVPQLDLLAHGIPTTGPVLRP